MPRELDRRIANMFQDREIKKQIDGGYTRFVSLIKVALLATAIAMLVLVISWSMTTPEEPTVGFSINNLQDGEDVQEGMTRGRFVGVDSRKQPYIITAESARPIDTKQGHIALQQIQADITLEEGSWLTLIATTGVYNQGSGKLILPEDVFIYADNGMELRTRTAEFDLKKSLVTGDSPLQITSALGRLQANSFRFTKNEGHFIFSGNVTMMIKPNRVQ